MSQSSIRYLQNHVQPMHNPCAYRFKMRKLDTAANTMFAKEVKPRNQNCPQCHKFNLWRSLQIIGDHWRSLECGRALNREKDALTTAFQIVIIEVHQLIRTLVSKYSASTHSTRVISVALPVTESALGWLSRNTLIAPLQFYWCINFLVAIGL